jgi:hypothetical protein
VARGTYFQFAGGKTCSRTMHRFMLLCRSPVITAAAAACCRFGLSFPTSFFATFSSPLLATFCVDGTASSVCSVLFDHIRTSLGRMRRCALGLDAVMGEVDCPPDVGGGAAAVADDEGGSDAAWDEGGAVAGGTIGGTGGGGA